jgi:4-phytase/acid phosphatase
MTRFLLCLACLLVLLPSCTFAQTYSASSEKNHAELKYVIYLSRHGVRSPTGKAVQYNQFSSAAWPEWDVPPGYLTAHGYQLMQLFGAYNRQQLSMDGLLSAKGCTDASSVSFYTDSDQRTRESGKALAEGLFPGCKVTVESLSEGTNDPIFHPHPSIAGSTRQALATAAIDGRIGGNPDNLTVAYHTQLAELDNILANCGAKAITDQKRTSLFDVPASLSSGKGDHMADLRSPLNTASTLTENLLLEYTQGMDASQVGWGCVDGTKLRTLIGLHTAASDFALRTPTIARMQATNLLDQIVRDIEQAVTHKPIPGSKGKPTDRALFLVGHDTNLTSIAGLLSLTWIADGRRDDTPPGGALVFELWMNPRTAEYSVRTYFTVQTLEQMRSATELTLNNPPQRVPVFLPGCSREDSSCTWPAFRQAIRKTIDYRVAGKR